MKKILVVDDEIDMLLLLNMIIKEKTPYEVITTNNPYEALEMFNKEKFDIVIADLKMPGMDGLQLWEEIRKINPEVPFILITAYGTLEAAQEAMEKEVFDFILKPFKKEQIIFTIKKAIKWLELQKENKILKEKLKFSEDTKEHL